MASFNLVGYLKPIKDTEKFKGFSVTNYDSGWMTEKLRFNVVAGDNRHMVEINAGRWQKEDKNVIYAFSKASGTEKSKPIQIPWSKRNDPDVIDSVAGWKLYTVDTDTFSHRKALEESGDTEALEASNKKRKHFLAATEFCEYANKLVNSDKAKDWKFRVTGNINYVYSAKNGQYYATYEVNKIYRVADETEPMSEVIMDFYFAEDAMDRSDFEDTGKATVSGYTMFYDNNTKRNWFCPITLAVRDKVDGWEYTFNEFENDEVRKIGLILTKIDGAQKVDITYDDLSDKVKANIDRGMITLERAIRDAGGQAYGDRIQELRISDFGKGYTGGSETTIYTADQLCLKPGDKVEEELDLFANDDDDEL